MHKVHSFMRALALPLLIAASFTNAHADDKITIKHSQGETEVIKNPKTIAVLDWSTLDSMATLDLEAQGIPSGNIVPVVLKQYADDKFTKIGTLFEPDFEAIKNLNPDIIILGRRAAGKYEEVSKYAPTLDLTPDPTDLLGSVARNLEILGEIYGVQDKAQAQITKLNELTTELKSLTKDQGTGLTVLTTGGKMAAFGIGTRFGLMHDVFGMQPATENLQVGRHGQSISYEYILEADPDWLFVMDRDAAIKREGTSAQNMMDNELVQATTAGTKKQIVYLDPEAWYLLDSSGANVLQQNMNQLIEVFKNK